MRIVTHRNNYHIRAGCLLCGEPFELLDPCHDAYESVDHLGMVCEMCITLSDDEMHAKLQAHAASLRDQAEDLEALAQTAIQRQNTYSFIDVATGTPISGQFITAAFDPHKWSTTIEWLREMADTTAMQRLPPPTADRLVEQVFAIGDTWPPSRECLQALAKTLSR